MIITKGKIYTKIIIIGLVVGYLIFPMSVFYGAYNKVFENASADRSFKVVVYKIGIYNFFSLYKVISGEDYFFVVYDKCGDVVFKPSLWFGVDRSIVYGGFHFSKHDKNTLFFPTNDGVDSIELISNMSGCS